MKDDLTLIEQLTKDLLAEGQKQVGGNKSAGVRARKYSLELEKALKQFRKDSINYGG